MLPPLPRCSSWVYSSLILPSHVSLPRKGHRVGLHIVLFEACSAFTRVAACTLARSPIRDPLIRGLQTFRLLHACSGCFRLERLPGGACTHWKAPPCHGAHPSREIVRGDPECANRGSRRPNRRLLSDPSRPAARSLSPHAGLSRTGILGRHDSARTDIHHRATKGDAVGTPEVSQREDRGGGQDIAARFGGPALRDRGRERLIRQRPCAASPHRGSELTLSRSFRRTTWARWLRPGRCRQCAGDRTRCSAPSAALGSPLSRTEGDLSAGLHAKHCGLRHQDHAGTLLLYWPVG